jgi:hypothetical protein
VVDAGTVTRTANVEADAVGVADAGNGVNVEAGAAGRTTPVFQSVTTMEGTTSINKPAGTVEGDLLIAMFGDFASSTFTPPAGWTALGSVYSAGGTNAQVFYKIAGASEPSSYTWTIPGADYPFAAMLRYDSVDTSTPTAAIAGAAASGTSKTIPGVTTANDNSRIIAFAASCYPTGAPSGMTQRASWLNFGGLMHGAYDEEIASAGATGTRTLPAADNTGVAIMVAINGAP